MDPNPTINPKQDYNEDFELELEEDEEED